MARMSTLDASVVIAHFNAADAHHRAATEFLLAHAGTRHWIGPLNLAEVLVAHQRAGTLAQATEAIADMGIAECAFPEDTARRLVEIRGRTGLKMLACCLLLAAHGAADRDRGRLLRRALAGVGCRHGHRRREARLRPRQRTSGVSWPEAG